MDKIQIPPPQPLLPLVFSKQGVTKSPVAVRQHGGGGGDPMNSQGKRKPHEQPPWSTVFTNNHRVLCIIFLPSVGVALKDFVDGDPALKHLTGVTLNIKFHNVVNLYIYIYMNQNLKRVFLGEGGRIERPSFACCDSLVWGRLNQAWGSSEGFSVPTLALWGTCHVLPSSPWVYTASHSFAQLHSFFVVCSSRTPKNKTFGPVLSRNLQDSARCPKLLTLPG